MIAKVCDRSSRRDSWFENRLVNFALAQKCAKINVVQKNSTFTVFHIACLKVGVLNHKEQYSRLLAS